MEESPNQAKSKALIDLVQGPLSSSVSKLSAHSRFIPSGKDFHFYKNFPQFSNPASELTKKSQSLLQTVNSSALINGSPPKSDLFDDLDDSHDFVVNLNDEILENFNNSVDQFKNLRIEREETNEERIRAMEEGGFEIVSRERRNRNVGAVSRERKTDGARSMVPYHIATIRRPQDDFNILVNNSNTPFEHVWLERSSDGCRYIHPMENLSVLDFIDCNIHQEEPVKPLPIEETPFTFVEDVKDLKELAIKLRGVDEFSVDLEHNQYRSFQGLTCLMQISTRTEDFIIDTLKLRVHVGPHLRDVFKDPSKRKVMHGADRDILWLQRDFGIYVCNLFDTGQASRVLQLEKKSLEFLLQYFCGITANKEYQQADWRLRPLPSEMVKYAREDTHYLLFMYDVMRRRLLSESLKTEIGDTLLTEVYKRSSEICMQLYEKDLLTESSYLRLYGLCKAKLNSQQLAVVAGLWNWRDGMAREEDESTGYILPNRALIEIAKQMPLTSGLLMRLVKSKHPYVEQNLGSVVNVIRNSVKKAASFEPIVDYLKNSYLEAVSGEPKSTALATTLIPEKLQSMPTKTAVTMTKSVSAPGPPANVNVVTVQKKEKPAGAFGALFGGSVAKKKIVSINSTQAQVNAAAKLEQIRSSVALPFHSFSGSAATAPPPVHVIEPPAVTPVPAIPAEMPEDVIPLDGNVVESSDSGEEGEPPTPAPAATRQWHPFDYLAARKEAKFGGRQTAMSQTVDAAAPANGRRHAGMNGGSAATSEFSAPRRCQAFPASGNRSATFR